MEHYIKNYKVLVLLLQSSIALNLIISLAAMLLKLPLLNALTVSEIIKK